MNNSSSTSPFDESPETNRSRAAQGPCRRAVELDDAARLVAAGWAGPTTAVRGRLEFRYLDGLRGFAALAVVLFHALLFTGTTQAGSQHLGIVNRVIGYGYLGVPVFIVLSGYVLMLPVLRTADLQTPGGFLRYVGRRARRILPPYWAALLIVVGLIAAVPLLRRPRGTQWDTKLPLTTGGVVSHVLLIHDLRPGWIGKIDGPMWSVAVEWQIYFLMPLVLLPLWRRVHPVLVVGACLAASIIPSEISVGPSWLVAAMDSAHAWLIGLFAVGMLAAQATLAEWRVPRLGVVTAIAVGGLAGAFVLRPSFQHEPLVSETATGLVVGLALVWTGRVVIAGSRPAHVRLLERRAPMLLGLMSYSVYLLHSPLLALANLATLPLGLSVPEQWALLTFVGVPTDLAICAGFYWLVERRFKNTRQRHAAEELSYFRGSGQSPIGAVAGPPA